MKKLIPALCMLLVAATLLGTSTYAWFSMNETVEATNMQVKASTDNAYLIISKGETLSGNSTFVTSDLDASLKPVKPMGTLTPDNINNITAWGTASSNDPDDANVGATLTALDSGTAFTNYVAKESFMVGVLANSGTVQKDLTLKSLTISNVDAGITVVLVCDGNIVSTATNITGGTTKLADAEDITTTGVKIDVYIYIDGSNENVKTNNATNLSGAVEFEVGIN